MVGSSAAAWQQPRPPILPFKTPQTKRVGPFHSKRGGGVELGISLFSGTELWSGPHPCTIPLGMLDYWAVCRNNNNHLIQCGLIEMSRIGLASPIMPHRVSKPAALNCLLSPGTPLVSRQTSVGLFTHRGTIVYLFNRFSKLDAESCGTGYVYSEKT